MNNITLLTSNQLCCWLILLGFYRKFAILCKFTPDHPPQWLTPCGPPSLNEKLRMQFLLQRG